MASEPSPISTVGAASPSPASQPAKLHGRAFYESIGSPKSIVAPMVNQSEFAWRMLTRSFLPSSQRSSILAYSPMLHARLFADTPKYREQSFQPSHPPPVLETADTESPSATQTPPSEPYLDGNPALDRPLIVQFCANDPSALLSAAQLVAPHCDAVDLNLGCPQGIARKGHYGAFLQEDQDLIYRLIRTLHESLPVPVTAKIRILETPEATLAYARNVLAAGASFLTVHGRRRNQKGHLTGVADWAAIRHLRENLPPETVLFANGNILQPGDVARSLEATGADGVMSAEGNLSDPAIFAPVPAAGENEREYWRGSDGRRGGWRVDAVMRRYFDILHKHVLGQEPPARRPLFLPGDDDAWLAVEDDVEENEERPAKRRKRGREDRPTNGRKKEKAVPSTSPNFTAVKAHLFHLLRHFVSIHTDVRDAIARTCAGDMEAYEKILDVVERKVARALKEYERTGGKGLEGAEGDVVEAWDDPDPDPDSSAHTVRRCKRPWWVAQPIVRPLPAEAMAKGAIVMSKKDQAKLAVDAGGSRDTEKDKGPSVGPNPEAGSGEPPPPAAVADAVAALEETTAFPTSRLVAG